MAGFAMMLYGLLVVVAVGLAWMTARRRGPVRVGAAAALTMQAARRRAIVAIGFALVLLLAGFVVSLAVPGWLGLAAAIAPAVAGAGGLLLYAATPPPQDRETHARFSASLDRRGPWTIAPRGGLTSLGVVLVLLLGVLIFTGATSDVDDRGLYRAITFATSTHSSTATPYPGWFYAVPLMGATALLVIAAWIALRRIATTASLTGEGLQDMDRLWRVRSAQIIVGIAFATVSLQIGGVAVFAGTTMRNAQFHPGVPVAWDVLATLLLILGIVATVVSIASLTLATLRTFTLPGQLSHAHDSEMGGSVQPPAVGGRA